MRCLLYLLLAGHAAALTFDRVRPDRADGRNILWVRDCGTLPGDGECSDEAGQFSTGDSQRLAGKLREHRYEEVWLYSGGGNLLEGVEIGRVLRRFQATVRVPPGSYCISACTVAFLGGLFRFVDPGGTYQVHSASGLLGGFRSEAQVRTLNRLRSGTEAEAVDELKRLLRSEWEDARYWARVLLPYFQEALLPPGAAAPSTAPLLRWEKQETVPPPALDGWLHETVARIRSEGVAAAQEIVMGIERSSMQQAIEQIRPLVADLGPRAGPALKMLEAMYSSRITGTASLSQEELLKMGYITRIFQP